MTFGGLGFRTAVAVVGRRSTDDLLIFCYFGNGHVKLMIREFGSDKRRNHADYESHPIQGRQDSHLALEHGRVYLVALLVLQYS